MVLLIGIFVLLIPCVITDIRWMKVPAWYIGIFITAAIIANLVLKQTEPAQMIAGVILGVIFFVISFFTKQAVAYGDSCMIVAIGIWCGIRLQLWIITIGFLLASVVGIIWKLVTGEKRNVKLPFAPFLLVSATVIGIINL